MAHHLPFLAVSESYFTQSGVVLFFVLSGIVLLRPYLRRQRKFETIDYFIRRLKRIYPPYFAALVFGYLVMVVIKTTPETFYSHVWRWMDLKPWVFLKQLVILNFNHTTYYNLAWWSLQVELIFYILVPFVVPVFLVRAGLNYFRIALVILVTIAGSFMLQQYLDHNYPYVYSNEHVFLNAFRFIDYPVSFLLGVYMAKYDFKKSAAVVFGVIGMIGLMTSTYYVVHHDYTPFINISYSFIYTSVILFAFNCPGLQRILDRPIMIWLGERSYSLFLIHFSVFYLTDYICSNFGGERSMVYGVLSRVIGIPLAFLAAMLLFHFVERKQARGLVTDKIFWPWQLGKLRKGALEENARKQA